MVVARGPCQLVRPSPVRVTVYVPPRNWPPRNWPPRIWPPLNARRLQQLLLVTGPCFPVFLSGWREDVEDHGPLVRQRAPAVRHVRRRLPEVTGPDVMLDAVLDPDPLALEADAPLTSGVRVHGGDGARRDLEHGEHPVLDSEDAGPEPFGQLAQNAAPLEVVKVPLVDHGALLVR